MLILLQGFIQKIVDYIYNNSEDDKESVKFSVPGGSYFLSALGVLLVIFTYSYEPYAFSNKKFVRRGEDLVCITPGEEQFQLMTRAITE